VAERQEKRPLAARLKEERVRLGLTQPVVAELGGVSKTTIVSYESGAHVPDAVFLGRLASQGLDVCYVVTGERAAVKAGADLDWDLLQDILDVVGTFEERRQQALSSAGKARIIRILYCSSIASGRVDPGIAMAVLEQAA
jgi:transcriptional regulator with XRE-family HTH domain